MKTQLRPDGAKVDREQPVRNRVAVGRARHAARCEDRRRETSGLAQAGSDRHRQRRRPRVRRDRTVTPVHRRRVAVPGERHVDARQHDSHRPGDRQPDRQRWRALPSGRNRRRRRGRWTRRGNQLHRQQSEDRVPERAGGTSKKSSATVRVDRSAGKPGGKQGRGVPAARMAAGPIGSRRIRT